MSVISGRPLSCSQKKRRLFGSAFNYPITQITQLPSPLGFPDSIHKRFQFPRPRGMAKLAQGLGFDLADTLAGDRERLADLFQGMLGAVFQTKPHLDDFLFARR